MFGVRPMKFSLNDANTREYSFYDGTTFHDRTGNREFSLVLAFFAESVISALTLKSHIVSCS